MAGVEDILYFLHYLYGRGVHGFLQKALLLKADTVLTGEDASQGQGNLDDFVDAFHGAVKMFLIAAVRKHHRVEITVPHVPREADGDVVFPGAFPALLDEVGYPVARHGHVLVENGVSATRNIGEMGGTRLPVAVGFRLVPGHPYLAGAVFADSHDLLGFRLHGLRQAVHLDEEDYVRHIEDFIRQEPAELLERPVVHELDLRGQDAAGDDFRHRLAGNGDVADNRHDSPAGLRLRQQPQRHLGDDAQCALGADEQHHQFIPGAVLGRQPAEFHYRAIGKHDFQSEDVLLGDPVFQAGGAAGVLRYNPAHRAARGALGVGREEQSLFSQGVLEVL